MTAQHIPAREGAAMEENARRAVIGTAGHVDHGKTTLVKALTGIDTDRLPEEKSRGISIELGFAEFRLPSGRSAAIVDVPGHERFIRNMLAGASGIDLVMLVVAADEGVMPQTREHFDIVRLLGVTKGLLVITKSDLASPEWLDLVKEDIDSLVQGSFLEGAPVLPVSAVTGEGLADLRRAMDLLLDEVPLRDSESYPRLPVDRVFTMAGYGTVATGTLVSGMLRVEDRLEILPAKKACRVRGLQVHGRAVSAARSGQRVAVNLAGVSRDDVARGDTLTTPGWLEPSRRIAARLSMLPGAPFSLRNLSRVHLHYGTAETIARVVLIEKDEVQPGESTLARLSTQQPVVVSRGDRFIIRSYSPVTTIGGGTVIASPSSHRRKSREAVADLLAREKGDPQSDLLLVMSRPPYVYTASALGRKLGLTGEATTAALKVSEASGRTQRIGGGHISTMVLDTLIERTMLATKNLLIARPLRLSAGKEELRNLSSPESDSRVFGLILGEAARRGLLSVSGERVSLTAPPTPMPERLERALREASRRLEVSRFSPPSADEIGAGLDLSPEENSDLILRLVESGWAVRLSESLLISSKALDEARDMLVARLAAGGAITVGEFRDMLGTTRKFALPLLEHFDQSRVTRRAGDERVLFSAGR
jgi:selenocysteine-specific elongation factor